jgi:hypothetical protein
MKMSDSMNPYPPSPSPQPQDTPADATPPTPQADNPVAAAVMKFKSCRWRCAPEDGEYCTHRDVLPFAGKEGFKAESWCPECAYYKLRRTPKKRDWAAERSNY